MSYNICNVCGRNLIGLTFNYGTRWTCSDCIVDKTDVLHCETGCKVKAIRLNAGYNSDIEDAKKYLIQDGIYTVESVEVDSWNSHVILQGVKNIHFNSAHFTRVE